MVYGMITLHNNDDMRPRRNVVKVKKVMPWEMRQGHQEHKYTVFDNRPKRQRTRRDIDKQWRNEYDM